MPHILQTAFLIFQNPFVHAHTISNKTTVFTRQVAVGRKVKVRATVFISWQITFRILFFVPVTNKPGFNIQSTKHFCISFCFRNLREDKNQILVYATILPFNVIHFTGLFLYSHKTLENLWLSEVFRQMFFSQEKLVFDV